MSDLNPVKANRRWHQFRLRTPLLVLLLLSLPLSWFGTKIRAAREQREAVNAIRSLGGEVKYCRAPSVRRGTLEPAWLRKMLGEDFFANVQTVDMGKKATDADLNLLGKFADLKVLDLGDTRVTDAGLEQIEQLPALGMLILNGIRISDARLKHLRGLVGLKTLDLRSTQVTSKGLRELRNAIPHCRILR